MRWKKRGTCIAICSFLIALAVGCSMQLRTPYGNYDLSIKEVKPETEEPPMSKPANWKREVKPPAEVEGQVKNEKTALTVRVEIREGPVGWEMGAQFSRDDYLAYRDKSPIAVAAIAMAVVDAVIAGETSLREIEATKRHVAVLPDSLQECLLHGCVEAHAGLPIADEIGQHFC